MHCQFRNVNDAFAGSVASFSGEAGPIVRTTSRAGDVLQYQAPVIFTFERPMERVLFNGERDANPFFHLFEALWMLAGRNDVAPLAFYNSQIADIASDDGLTFNGAYGYRWRRACRHLRTCYEGEDGNGPPTVTEKSVDQLDLLAIHLRKKADTRRAVLQMWNVEDDLLKIDETKDVCCNTCVYFLRRHIERIPGERPEDYLDMTVCNRSNDLIWGLLGANIVHFAFLLEYMAAKIGVRPGLYHQFTNNVHVYTERFKPEIWLSDRVPDFYAGYEAEPYPLVQDVARFDLELPIFVNDYMTEGAPCSALFQEPFLQKVAWPAHCAFRAHKVRDYAQAVSWCGEIEASDWRIACTNWIQKRRANYEVMKDGANPYLVNELERRKETAK